MFRRRRPLKNESIHFSFDSFLDLVTNVVGIIIRLILVTWVGARAYHTSMQWIGDQPSETPMKKLEAPKIVDDPLHARIEQSRRELDEAKERLLEHLKDVDTAEMDKDKAKVMLAGLLTRRSELDAELKKLDANGAAQGAKSMQANVSIAEVRARSKKLLAEIKKLEASPVNTKQLKYHAPLSRAVQGEEMFFECRGGRVCYIDLPIFMQEVKASMDEIGKELKTTFRVERRTSPVGPYRLKYAIERERTGLDGPDTPTSSGYRYGLTEWVVEPTMAERGESVEQALRPNSEFRQLVDNLDPRLTVVTFWVYPDSFETFRKLRDHLYDRGHDIAGRPLPADAPIAASRFGTASRGQ